MICKHGDFPIEIIQGNSYRRVYTFYDADDNILNDDLLQSVVLSVARLNYSQVLNWNEDEQGYVFLLSAETTDEFPYCKGTYDVALTFKDTQVETEIYRSPLQIFKKNVVNPIVDNNGYMTCDNSKVTVRTGIQVVYAQGGTQYHDELLHRDLPDQHPISAITGLQDALDGKQPSGDYVTSGELDALADIVDNKADSSEIPTKTSDLTNDSGFITSIPSEYVTDTELDTALQGVRDDIPTKVSDLTNDSDFTTKTYVDNIDANLQGQIDDLQAEKMPLTEIDAVPTDGSTNLVESGGVYDAIDGVQHDIDDIEALISSQATSTNKLVSASEMGDAISAVEAKQIYATSSQGSFATKAQLLNATTFYNADGTVATPTKNDVVYVLADESHDNKSAKYVIADITQSGIVWGFVITFSDTTFTQSQMDAINSGVTSQKVSAYDSHIANKSNPHEVTYQQLGGTKPTYTAQEVNALPISGGTMSGNINMGNNKITIVGNPTNDADAANKQYVDAVADSILPEVTELDNGKILQVVGGAWSDSDVLDDYALKTDLMNYVEIAQGIAHEGEFLVVGDDGNVTTQSLSVWQGGSY